jgi:uncharacterized membrane protein YdjX (TVP38/TMEM64 family)
LSEKAPPPATGQFRGLVISGAALLLLIAGLAFLFQRIGVERIQEAIAAAGALGPLLYIAIKALTYVFAPLTAGPLQLTAGLLFGVVPGIAFSLIGEVIGGSINFWIARIWGRALVVRLAGAGSMSRIDSFYQDYLSGVGPLAVSRLLFFSFFDIISYAAGLTRLPYSSYLFVAVVVGLIPTTLIVLSGTLLIDNPALILALFLAGSALSALPVAYRIWQRARARRRGTAPPGDGPPRDEDA